MGVRPLKLGKTPPGSLVVLVFMQKASDPDSELHPRWEKGGLETPSPKGFPSNLLRPRYMGLHGMSDTSSSFETVSRVEFVLPLTLR